MRIGGYLTVAVAPGPHKVTATMSLLGQDTGKVRAETTFTATAGTKIYLRYKEEFKSFVPIVIPKGGVYAATSMDLRFEVVPEPVAVAELAKTKVLELEKG